MTLASVRRWSARPRSIGLLRREEVRCFRNYFVLSLGRGDIHASEDDDEHENEDDFSTSESGLIRIRGLRSIRIAADAPIHSTMGDKTVDALHSFDNTEVAFCTRSECLKSLFVSLAFVGGQRCFVTVKFDNDRSLLQA